MRTIFTLLLLVCSALPLAGQRIQSVEYFFNTDPGFGRGKSVPISQDSIVNASFTADLSGLTDGLHTLYVRSLDNRGRWSSLYSRPFFVVRNLPSVRISEAEYFFDTDPGYGNGRPLQVPEGKTSELANTLPIDRLSDGIHTLYVRAKDNQGRWSSIYSRPFIKQQRIASETPAAIAALEYQFGSTGAPQTRTVPATQLLDGSVKLTFPNDLPLGEQTLMVRAKNADGVYSGPVFSTVTLNSSVNASLALSAPATTAKNDTLSLTLSVGSPNPVYDLYGISLQLQWNSDSLQFIPARSQVGTFLGTNPLFFQQKIANSRAVDLSVAATSGEGVSGSGNLVTLKFKVLGTGNAAFSIANAKAEQKNETAIDLSVSGASVALVVPTITLGTAPAAFSTRLDTPSPARSYTLSGSFLTDTLFVRAPAGFQVSFSETTGFTNRLFAVPSSGSVSQRTVWVRIAASATTGAVSGSIEHISRGVNVPLAVSGTVNAPALTLTGTLNAFATTTIAASAAQTYRINAEHLAAVLRVLPPSRYVVRAGASGAFADSLQIAPVNGRVDTTIYVQLTAGAEGTFNGDIRHLSRGLTTQNVAVNGTVTPPPPTLTASTDTLRFATSPARASLARQFTVSGTYLTSPVELTLEGTDAASYEMSDETNSTWRAAVSLQPSSGTLASTLVNVRLKSGLTLGASPKAVAAVKSFGITREVVLSGIVSALDPQLTASVTSLELSGTAGTVSAVQQYTLTGVDLLEPVTVEPSRYIELSRASGGPFQAQALTIPSADFSAPVVIYARISANTPVENYSNQSIAHRSAEIAPLAIPVTGQLTIPTARTIVVDGRLEPFQTTSGVPSQPQRYELFGYALSSSITVAAPSSLEFSESATGSYQSSLSVTHSGGRLNKAVWVRISESASQTSQATSVDISHTSTFATTKTLRASVQVGAAIPKITASVDSLYGFSTVELTASTAQIYQVNATGLSGAVAINASTGWQVSTTSGTTGFSGSATLTPVSGKISDAQLWVRISATASPAARLTGTLTHTSTGLDPVVVALRGTVTALPDPVITLSTTSLSGFVAAVGIPSLPRSFSISGNFLRSPIVVTAGTGVQISLSENTGFANTLSLTPSSGIVASRLMYVRLTAGTAVTASFNGEVAFETTALPKQTMTISGRVDAAPSPQLVVNADTLRGFSTIPGTASATRTYTLTASYLTTDLSVQASSGYELAKASAGPFSPTLTYTPSSGSIASQTIWVRITAAQHPISATFDGTITHTSAGLSTKVMVLQGAITNVPPPSITLFQTSLNAFSTTTGTASAIQTYTMSGQNLLGPVSITPPEGFEISLTQTTWVRNATAPLQVTPTSGSIPITAIYVRVSATASAGAIGGNITHTTNGSTQTANMAVTGTVTLTPGLFVSRTTVSFTPAPGQPSAPVSYEVSGNGLTSNATISFPWGIEFATSESGPYTLDNGAFRTLSLPVTGGTLPPTVIWIRASGFPASGTPSISHTASGVSQALISVSITITGSAPGTIFLTGPATVSFRTENTAQTVPQQLIFSGVNLPTDVTISSPSGFLISRNENMNAATNSILLSRVDSRLYPTSIWVVLAASNTPGTISGNLMATASAVTRSVPLTGTRIISPSTYVGPTDAIQNVSASQTITASAIAGATEYEFETATTSDFTDKRVIRQTSTQISVWQYPSNTTVYWRFRAFVNTEWTPFSVTRSYKTAAEEPWTFTPSFPVKTTFEETDYRLVFIPGDIGERQVQVSSVMTGSRSTDWRLFREPGDASQPMVEMLETDVLQTNVGYWMLSSIPAQLNRQVSMNGTLFPNLKPGWNIVGNPSLGNGDISLAELRAVLGLAPGYPIHTWNSRWTTASNVAKGIGYYVFVPSAKMRKQIAQEETSQHPFRQISEIVMNDNGLEDAIQLATHPEARAGLDGFDWVKPRNWDKRTTILFSHPDWIADQQTFLRDTRPDTESSSTWSALITAASARTVNLKMTPIEDTPALENLWLIEGRTGKMTALTSNKDVSLQLVRGENQVAFVTGDYNDAVSAAQKLMPLHIELFQNYPNPFNPSTVIRYNLNNAEQVTLEVFDVQGRRIAQLARGVQEAGRHEIHFNAAQLSAGVYIYRLVAGNSIITKKMALVK